MLTTGNIREAYTFIQQYPPDIRAALTPTLLCECAEYVRQKLAALLSSYS